MNEEQYEKSAVAPEQVRYANILFWGSWGGIFVLVVTFFIYVSGLLKPFIPMESITKLWSMSVSEYLHQSHAPTGWGWALYCGYGDFLNFIGIAILSGLTIIGFLSLVPAYVGKKDIPYLIIAVAEICVLVLAASGILTVGH
jgi:hypothetical protein